MFNFCTYFDQHYLVRGLALYRSLREQCSEFRFWVLCMDEITYQTLTELKLYGVYPIALEEFERDDESLGIAKANRSRIEYYFTCTPSLLLYILNYWPGVELITYLDADLFFFASPTSLFKEMAEASIAIIAHRFPPSLKGLKTHGIYNVGWLSFRRDINGFTSLKWWRDRCIEWCYDRIENSRFADQKYLDDWPIRFQNVIVLEHKGANVAPWNLSNYHLSYHNGNMVTIDNQPLIFFHFHGLKKITSWWYDPGWRNYRVRPSLLLHKRIYTPYIKALFDVNRWLFPTLNSRAISGLKRGEMIQQERPISVIRQVAGQLRRFFSVCKNALSGGFIFLIFPSFVNQWKKSNKYYGLNNLDKRLREYLKKDNGFFIEIGANDGVSQSNTLWFEKNKGWKGILIEVVPALSKQCRINRPKCRVFNYGCVSNDYKNKTLKIIYANLMSVVAGHKAKHEEEKFLDSARPFCKKQFEIEVEARTMTSILEECNVEEIDFLSLDVEGYELNVLKGLDLNKYHPNFILVETENRGLLDEYLKEYYIFVEKLGIHDYLYKYVSI